MLVAFFPVLLALLAAPARGEGERPFHEQVDLGTLGALAVQAEGRVKSLSSHANTLMDHVSGSRLVSGQPPLFTYLDLTFRPEAYVDADLVYVKNKQVREQIAVAVEGVEPELAGRLAAFRATGLVSPKILGRPEVEALLGKLAGDLIRTEKQVTQIRSALAVADPRFLLGRLRLIPPADGAVDRQWHGIEEVMFVPGSSPEPDEFVLLAERTPPIEGIDLGLQSRIADAWRDLVNGWNRGDAAAVNAAAAGLASALPAVHAESYPDAARLRWEHWYFAKDQLTSIWLVYLAAVVALLVAIVYRWPNALRLAFGVFGLALLLQTGAVLLRWWISGRWPNSNMFEAVTTAAWFGAVGAVLLEWLARRTAMRGLFALGAAVSSMVALMIAHFMPVYLNPNISNMMPVLHDVWLYIHTNVIIFSYCLIFMAAVTGFGYLAWRLAGGGEAYARVGGAGSLVQGGVAGGGPGGGIATARGPSWGEVLDGTTMILIEVSFVLLWAGIVMGAIWADHSWGRPWGWDPKEVFALNTFVIFLILIHVRLKSRDKGLWTAVLALAGAAVMLFNWIVINFVITGLHSYA
jgi:cytochrome c-type biogenesis protein CcsB